MATSLDDGQVKNVLRQVEFYFSDSNLPRDNFLKKSVQESEDGLVSLALICSFTRMRSHLGLGNLKPEDVPEETLLAVAKALRKSSALKVSDDGKRIGRNIELSKPETVIEHVDSTTIAASPLPHDVKIEDVESFFGQHVKMSADGAVEGSGSESRTCELLGELLRVQQQLLLEFRAGPQPQVGTIDTFMSLGPHTFYGTECPSAAEEWLIETEDLLVAAQVPAEDRINFVKVLLRGIARVWWDVEAKQFPDGVTWLAFRERFLSHYFPKAAKTAMAQEFMTLRQGSMSVGEYVAEFTRLSRYAPTLVTTDAAKRDRFILGLSVELQSAVEPHSNASFLRVITAAERQEILGVPSVSRVRKRPTEVFSRSSGPVVAKRPQFTAPRLHFRSQHQHQQQQYQPPPQHYHQQYQPPRPTSPGIAQFRLQSYAHQVRAPPLTPQHERFQQRLRGQRPQVSHYTLAVTSETTPAGGTSTGEQCEATAPIW